MSALKSVENNSQVYEFNSGWQRLEHNTETKASRELEDKVNKLKNDVNNIVEQIKKIDEVEIEIEDIKASIGKVKNTIDELLEKQKLLIEFMDYLKKQNNELVEKSAGYKNILTRHDTSINELMELIQRNEDKPMGLLSRIVGKR